MSKVEGHAEGERGSEEVFVQARSYGNLIKPQACTCLVYPFMTSFFVVVGMDFKVCYHQIYED